MRLVRMAAFAVCDCLYRNGARFIHTDAPEDGFTSGTYLEWMKGFRAPASRSSRTTISRLPPTSSSTTTPDVAPAASDFMKGVQWKWCYR